MDEELIRSVQKRLYNDLTFYGLPLKPSKTTPLGTLVLDHLTFIAQRWKLARSMITLKLERVQKLNNLAQKSALEISKQSQNDWETQLGGAIWIALARRCTLSCLRVAFRRYESSDDHTRLKATEELKRLATLANLASVDFYKLFLRIVLNADASKPPALYYTQKLLCQSLQI